MALKLKGCNYYRVIIRSTYDYDILIQAPTPEEALDLAKRKHKNEKVISVTEDNNFWLKCYKGVSK
jgi:hypothetical protein